MLTPREYLSSLTQERVTEIGPLRWAVVDGGRFPQIVVGTHEGKLGCTCGGKGCDHIKAVKAILGDAK